MTRTTAPEQGKTYTVLGKKYRVWVDFWSRATYAQSEDGEMKRIYGGGYITKDLTVRKAISYAFKTGSFRK